ncbi:NAD(P)-binding protein [Auricularia subglabra TFB-10046 SS5]|nr:NAD(P)-binding protein [Auricularia subglabra TFB-10046 SS5]
MTPTDKDKPLAGKVALVTGSTTGLGLRIYRQLATLGAKVYIAGRNEEAGRKAAAEFDSAVFVRMDLSTIDSSHEAAQAFLALEPERLDILVNNAALLADVPYELNEDGIVKQMAVNHFGHFVLTNELLPLLEKTSQLPGADVRILPIGSGAIQFTAKDRRFDSLDSINANLQGESFPARMTRYGTSKLAQCLWSREIHRRLRAQQSKISVVVVNPGPVSSEGNLAALEKTAVPLRWLFKAINRTPEDAARSALWAVSVPEPAKFSGKCITRSALTGRFGEEPWAALMSDGTWEPLGKELWETSERIVAEKLAAGA